MVQHNHWSGKHCPRVLRDTPGAWENFLKTAVGFARDLDDVAATDITGADTHDEGPGAPLQPSGSERFVVIAKKGLRVRAGPGTDFEIVASLPFGAHVAVISRFGDWAMVDLDGDGGVDGAAHSAFLKSM